MATGTSLSQYAQAKILALTLQGTAPNFTFPSGGLYVALFTTEPTDTSAGTEVSGGSYARVQAQWTTPTQNATSGAYCAPTADIVFPTATANWGTIVGFALFDAATAGNMIYYGSVPSQSVPSGVTCTLAASGTTITLD